MPFGGLLTMGLIGAGSAIFGAVEGSGAAKTASGQEVAQQNQALDFQKQVFDTQQANQSPYLAAGSSSLGQLMAALQSGKLGPLEESVPGSRAAAERLAKRCRAVCLRIFARPVFQGRHVQQCF